MRTALRKPSLWLPMEGFEQGRLINTVKGRGRVKEYVGRVEILRFGSEEVINDLVRIWSA